MTRILSAPTLSAQPQALSAAPDRFDAVTVHAIEQAAADAYRRGRAEAAREAAVAADEAARRATAAIGSTLQQVVTELAAHREERTRADVDLALAVVEAVLRRAPRPDEVELVAMVRDALDHLDETRVVVRVDPAWHEPIREALGSSAGFTELEVVADPSVPAGEATVSGRWGRAEVGRARALETAESALRELLDD